MITIKVFIFWMTIVNTLPGTQLQTPVGPFKDIGTCNASHDVAAAEMKKMNNVVRGSVTIGVLGGCEAVNEFPKVRVVVSP